MKLNISESEAGDISKLAEIVSSAYMNEAIMQFAFKNWPDHENSRQFHKARLEDRFGRKGSKIYKATDNDGRILGFVCWTLEEPGQDEPKPTVSEELKVDVNPSPTSRLTQQLPPFLNAEFVIKSSGEFEQLTEHMKGGKHYYLSTFAVLPGEQGRGVGSQLLQYCLQIADGAGLRTWLIAFPGSHKLYLRSGFVDVDHREVDLNEWGRGQLCGFGVYRQYAMVREAQTLQS